MSAYSAFIESKRRRFVSAGTAYGALGPHLYPFQGDLCGRALDRGRFAIFADCGLGKTLIELDWGTNVPGRVLLLAPIAVARQIEREAERFGYDAAIGDNGPSDSKITLTNYERLHRFDPADFAAVILDESSILKAYDGKTRRRLIEAFGGHRYSSPPQQHPLPTTSSSWATMPSSWA